MKHSIRLAAFTAVFLLAISALAEQSEVEATEAEAQEAPARNERHMLVDQSFVFFTVDNNRSSVNGKPRDDGWTLKADYRMFSRGTKRDSFRFVVKKGNRKLGETVCEVGAENQVDKFASGPPALYVVGCYDRNQRIKQTGALTVEVYFMDDATDRETLIGTHDLLVRSVKRVRGTGEPDAPHHYVDRHSEVLSAYMVLQHNRADHPYGRLGPSFRASSGRNGVVLLVNTATDDVRRSNDGASSRLRCSVNGERIAIDDDQITGSETRKVYAVQTWGRGTQDQRDVIQFRQYALNLPLSFSSAVPEQTHDNWHPLGEKHDRWPHLEDHPGQWECEWRLGRDIVRIIRFTVSADGRIVPHPEQQAGLELGPNIFFVETEIPAKGSVWDVRVQRQGVDKNAFLGRGFRSAEGKALVRKLPNVGRALPRAR